MKIFVKRLGLLLGVVLVTYFVYSKYFAIRNGEKAPDFEATLIDGSSFKLSDLKGQYVLLDFWGSWCPPCRRENPKLGALHKKYGDKLTIVTIALEKNQSTWKKAADKDGFVWKHQIVEQNSFVMLSAIARKYKVTEIPAKFLISPEGKILGKLSFDQITTTMDQIE